MNSKCPNSNYSQPMNSAFGLNPQIIEKQKQILSEVNSAIRSMRVLGKKSSSISKRANYINTSLFGLYEEQSKLDIKYIMTSRLTQDVLESLFSQIRGLGRFNDHPSPNEVINRMRQLLLSNKFTLLKNQTLCKILK